MPSDPGNRNTLSDGAVMDYEMVIRLERLRVQEALNARDVAMERLAEACSSIRKTTAALNILTEEKEQLQKRLVACSWNNEKGQDEQESTEADRVDLETRLSSLNKPDTMEQNNKDDIKQTQTFDSTANISMAVAALDLGVLKDVSNVNVSVQLSNAFSAPATPKDGDAPESPWISLDGEKPVVLPTINTAEKIGSRYAVLASLPLPSNIPEDSLTPILVPVPYTLHDYIGTTSGLLRSQLGNYRVFQQSTTTWCPEREEHGYYLTPLFKCSTNPRVTTAHRWSAVDVSANLDEPTECFFNKDGKWYYAGVYKSFRLEDLCTQEWECLSPETSQALVKETLVARKYISPQNVYETGQLYSAGALKVACIGLQCIGFNNTLYRTLLEHAALCTQTGKWRAPAGGFGTGLAIAPAPAIPWTPPASGPASPVVRGPGTGPEFIQSPPLPPTVKILQHASQGSQDVSAVSASGVLAYT